MADAVRPSSATKRKSRVLATLDNPNFYYNASSQPAPILPTLPPASLGRYSTPKKQQLATPLSSVDYGRFLDDSKKLLKRKSPGFDLDYDGVGVASGSSQTPSRGKLPVGERGFALHYDEEAPVRAIDRGGPDQELRMAEFVSQGIENSANGLTTQKAMEKLGLEDMRDYIPGMEVRLLPHQIIGVSWMVDQEKNSKHKGGILADDMGLGKTVQMIAAMVINQPQDDDDDKRHMVLIVVPAALLLQWKEEIEAKTNGMWKIHIQHGKDKIKDPKLLAEKDIIITTYHTLNIDFDIPKDVESDNELAWLKRYGGPLSRINWFRVVLDEAQFIRNRRTHCSKAVAMLRSKYRWCLTGTPITNTLADIYGYLRFGHFRPFNDWDHFNQMIARTQMEDAPLAGERAQTVLMPLMLRRRKDATIDGEPILKLQPKHVDLITIEFSQDERDLYDMFEKRAQIQLNRFIRNNSVVKNHQHILAMILRLRQVCAHPYLVLSETIDFADPTALIGSDGEKEYARAVKQKGLKWANSLKKRFLDRAKALELAWDNEHVNEDDVDSATCPRCGDLFVENNGRILSCGHEICGDCVQHLSTSEIEHDGNFGNNDEKDNIRIEKEFEIAAAKGLRPCPTCKKMQDLRPNAVFLASAFLPSREGVQAAVREARKRPRSPLHPPQKKAKLEIVDLDALDLSSSDDSDDSMPDAALILKSSPSQKGKHITCKRNNRESVQEEDSGIESDGKGKAKSEEQPSASNADLLAMWKQGGSNVESSAKMGCMVAYLKEWEVIGDKTIVFSQWTSMLDLCEQILFRNGIRSLRYDGAMNREAREYCLAQFRQPGGPKVILVSLKCGGVGLNLVSANRVINLDLSWNYAAESQAYDRVHRLGQEKEVFVKRLIIRNTIEERMLQLQETKLNLAGAALGEGGAAKLDKLSFRQLKMLFGLSKRVSEQTEATPAQ